MQKSLKDMPQFLFASPQEQYTYKHAQILQQALSWPALTDLPGVEVFQRPCSRIMVEISSELA